MKLLSTEAAPAGPAWLEARRREARERASTMPWPDTAEEVWRYSRVGELRLDGHAPAPRPTGPPVPEAMEALGAMGEVAGAVVLQDGHVVHAHVEERFREAGVWFGPLSAPEAPGAPEAMGCVMADPPDLFAALNDALSVDPVLLVVPPGVVVDLPFVVLDWLATDDVAVFPRLVVRAGAASELSVCEVQGSRDVTAFAAPVVEVEVGDRARVGHLVVQRRGPGVVQIGHQQSEVGSDATFDSAQAALGGDYVRTRTDSRLTGRGGSVALSAAYFGEGGQTLDFRTFQHHVAPDTTSNLLFKGALGDRSRSVYTGLIRVGEKARGTNAFQTNRNVKLSDEAWAESVPNLEIENNDVRCSHASTVGPVDEDQAFYLQSRGVPPVVAERLIVRGFFGEVLDRLPVQAAAATVREEIDARLDRRLAGVSGDGVGSRTEVA